VRNTELVTPFTWGRKLSATIATRSFGSELVFGGHPSALFNSEELNTTLSVTI
jgi:hypothetical protein